MRRRELREAIVSNVLLQAVCADLVANLEAQLRRARVLASSADYYVQRLDPADLAEAGRHLSTIRDLHRGTLELVDSADTALAALGFQDSNSPT